MSHFRLAQVAVERRIQRSSHQGLHYSCIAAASPNSFGCKRSLARLHLRISLPWILTQGPILLSVRYHQIQVYITARKAAHISSSCSCLCVHVNIEPQIGHKPIAPGFIATWVCSALLYWCWPHDHLRLVSLACQHHCCRHHQ